VFTKAHHQSPLWASWLQSIPSHPFSLKYILILITLSYVPHLASGIFVPGFTAKILYAFSSPCVHYMPYSYYASWFNDSKISEISGFHGGAYEGGCLAPCSLAEGYWRSRGACCLYRTCYDTTHHRTHKTAIFILIILGQGNKVWSSSLCNFFILPLLCPSYGQIFSSSPCSQTTPVCVLLLKWGTRF
jgi:hypothetical protein